ncbi:hypothetical protein ACJ2A9_04850 [Anaerobacillus sp. MEB173]|uniref:hypothetical protein n=1 Tax=Anaerobacillus sp. MEB173 TaxID=3383345 RepID=UPI003F8DF28C
MKVNTEQAFDMLPYAVELYEKLDIEAYRKKLATKYKNKKNVDVTKVGIEVIMYIVKNSMKVKEEFFQIVAIAENKSIDEVKAQSPIKTAMTFKEIFSDEELMAFFKAAMQ